MFDDAASIDEGAGIGDAGGFGKIVGDDDHRRSALAADVGHGRNQRAAHRRIDGSERLIQQQHIGCAGQRTGQRHAHLFAA